MQGFTFKDLLSFDKMVATTLIKLIYWLGSIFILLSGLAGIFSSGGLLAGFISIAGLLVGFLVWRVVCELWIVLFGIHDKLSHIEALKCKDISPAPQEGAQESQKRSDRGTL